MLGGILGRGSWPRCKSLTKQTKNRIELIKRKRKATLKFLREDIGDLLRNGLEDNAYGRAESLLAELALSECYDFVESACDFVLRHLPAIQKINHCPEDCREAISSLMFAAARFSDLPELRDLRQLFYELYENSIDLYTNKKFTETLSIKTFTMERKLRLMEDIAMEYKIDWTPDSSHKKLYVPKVPELKSVTSLPKETPLVPKAKPENLRYGRSASAVGGGYRTALPPPYTKPNTKWSESPLQVEERRRPRERELEEDAMIDKLLMKYSTTPSNTQTVKLKVLEKEESERSSFPSTLTWETEDSLKTTTRVLRHVRPILRDLDDDVVKVEKDSRLPVPTQAPTRDERDSWAKLARTRDEAVSWKKSTPTRDEAVSWKKSAPTQDEAVSWKKSAPTQDEAASSRTLTRAATFQNGEDKVYPSQPDHDDEGKEKGVEKLPEHASDQIREKTDSSKTLTRAATFQIGVRHVHPKLPDYDDLAARFASLRGG